MMSIPQLRSVTLSTAKPLSPSLRPVFVNLADPVQISMTNNSSMEKPGKFWTGERVLLFTVLEGLVAFYDSVRNNWLRLQMSVINFGDTRKRPPL